jgi:hypothetical protein
MSIVFTIESTGVADGPRVEFGPFDQETGTQQSIPGTLTRRVTYPDLEVSAVVECIFTGDKIEIQSISVQNNGTFVSTKALTQLALPAVIRAIAVETVPNSELWSNVATNPVARFEGPSFLAQVYWFEHISWGSPRASIMTYMNWSRTNANFHISKIAKYIALPGAHAKNKGDSSPKRARGN